MTDGMEFERRLAALEDQVRVLLDQRLELARISEDVRGQARPLTVVQAAVDNHTVKHADHAAKLDILIDGQAAVMAILRNRGQDSA